MRFLWNGDAKFKKNMYYFQGKFAVGMQIPGPAAGPS